MKLLNDQFAGSKSTYKKLFTDIHNDIKKDSVKCRI